MVDKSVTFSIFAEVLKEHLETNEYKKLKGEDLRFLELKKSQSRLSLDTNITIFFEIFRSF